VLAAACDEYTPFDTTSLRARAGYDFRCPRSQLRLTDLTPRTRGDGPGSVFGVDGCGRRATYVYTWEGTWMMNSDEHRERRSPPGDE